MIYLVFGGPFKAWGIAQNRGGGLVQRFEADIDSRVEGSRPILDEVLEYSLDKGIKQPTGMIKKLLDGSYGSSGHDVQGEVSGESFGNAFYGP